MLGDSTEDGNIELPAVSTAEFVNAPSGIDDPLLAGIEWVTSSTNFDM